MNTVNTSDSFRNGVYIVPDFEQLTLSDNSLFCASSEAGTEQFNNEENYIW